MMIYLSFIESSVVLKDACRGSNQTTYTAARVKARVAAKVKTLPAELATLGVVVVGVPRGVR